MKALIEAVNTVMSQVESVDKSMTIGAGVSTYKGVSDKDVKLLFNRAMRENGLAIFTTKIEPSTTVTTWDEEDSWSKSTPKAVKRKQSVFTEVLVTYELHHVGGDKIQLQGYGQGIDPQDKAAGKATTYALKYALLYNFLVATGSIDDADTTHSNDIETPQKKTSAPVQQTSAPVKTPLLPNTPEWIKAVEYLQKDGATIAQVKVKHTLTTANELLLKESTLNAV